MLDGDKENLLTNFEVQKLAYRRGLSSKETLVGVREARKFKLVEWIDGVVLALQTRAKVWCELIAMLYIYYDWWIDKLYYLWKRYEMNW